MATSKDYLLESGRQTKILSDTWMEAEKAIADLLNFAQSATPGGSTTTTTTVPVPRRRVAFIGDSPAAIAAMNGYDIATGLRSAPASFDAADVYTYLSKPINDPDGKGKTTTQNIADFRASGAEPDLWVIDLGTSDAGYPDKAIPQIDAVLAALGADARVLWVNIGTGYSYPSGGQTHETLNAAIKSRMDGRGKKGAVADWWTWYRDNAPSTDRINNTWVKNGVELTLLGGQQKYGNFVAGQIDAFLDSAATTTTTTNVTAPQPVYMNIADELGLS